MSNIPLKRIRNAVLYGIIRILFFLPAIIPRRAGLFLFELLGRTLFHVPIVEKRRTLENLRLVFGQKWTEQEIRRCAAGVYGQLGKNLFDAILLSRCSNARYYRIVTNDSFDTMQREYEKGRGVIVITGHLGCFEMMVQLAGRKRFNFVSIGQRLYDPKVDALITRMRSRNSVVFLHRDGSGREVLRLLKRGYIFGVLLDQDTNLEGVFARFLGRLAYTPSAPVRIAMRFSIPVFVAYTARLRDDSHHIFIHGPLTLENTGDYDRDLVFNVEKVNDILSGGILDFPDQWVWMHRRWNRKPSDEGLGTVPNMEHYSEKKPGLTEGDGGSLVV